MNLKIKNSKTQKLLFVFSLLFIFLLAIFFIIYFFRISKLNYIYLGRGGRETTNEISNGITVRQEIPYYANDDGIAFQFSTFGHKVLGDIFISAIGKESGFVYFNQSIPGIQLENNVFIDFFFEKERPKFPETIEVSFTTMSQPGNGITLLTTGEDSLPDFSLKVNNIELNSDLMMRRVIHNNKTIKNFFRIGFVLFLFFTNIFISIQISKIFLPTHLLGLRVCIITILELTILYVVTEILSIFHLITPTNISVFWTIRTLFGIIIFYLYNRINNKNNLVKTTLQLQPGTNSICTEVTTKLYKFHIIILFSLVVLIILINLFMAAAIVPYNWDSMTYHLPRVIFWSEHKSIAYYDTNIPRQNFSPPFAEYIQLHLYLMTGVDYLANLPQNFAAIGILFFVYDILFNILKCKKRAALFGVFLVLSMHIFQAESVSTQVDLIAAFIFLAAIEIVCDIADNKKDIYTKKRTVNYFILGLSCGLLYITKTNVCIPLLMFILTIIVSKLIRKASFWKLVRFSIISIICALIIAAPVFFRNYYLTGDILAKDYMGEISIGSLDLRFVLMNIYKNFASIAIGPQNYSFLVSLGRSISKFLQVNIDAKEITYAGSFSSINYSQHMDNASAHIFCIILLLAFVFVIPVTIQDIRKKDNNRSLQTIVAWGLLLQFPAMLAIVRWQPWVTRLMLPSLPGATIASVYFLYRSTVYLNTLFQNVSNPKSQILLQGCKLIEAILYIGSIGWFLHSATETIQSNFWPTKRNLEAKETRFDLYFVNRNIPAYDRICDRMEYLNPSSIGLFTGPDSYQYPVLSRFISPSVNIENVIMTKASKELSKHTTTDFFNPDLIFVMDLPMEENEIYYCNGSFYKCVLFDSLFGDYSLWEQIPE